MAFISQSWIAVLVYLQFISEVSSQQAALKSVNCNPNATVGANITLTFRLENGSFPSLVLGTVQFYHNGAAANPSCIVDRESSCTAVSTSPPCGCWDESNGNKLFYYGIPTASITDHSGDWTTIVGNLNPANVITSDVCSLHITETTTTTAPTTTTADSTLSSMSTSSTTDSAVTGGTGNGGQDKEVTDNTAIIAGCTSGGVVIVAATSAGVIYWIIQRKKIILIMRRFVAVKFEDDKQPEQGVVSFKWLTQELDDDGVQKLWAPYPTNGQLAPDELSKPASPYWNPRPVGIMGWANNFQSCEKALDASFTSNSNSGAATEGTNEKLTLKEFVHVKFTEPGINEKGIVHGKWLWLDLDKKPNETKAPNGATANPEEEKNKFQGMSAYWPNKDQEELAEKGVEPPKQGSSEWGNWELRPVIVLGSAADYHPKGKDMKGGPGRSGNGVAPDANRVV